MTGGYLSAPTAVYLLTAGVGYGLYADARHNITFSEHNVATYTCVDVHGWPFESVVALGAILITTAGRPTSHIWMLGAVKPYGCTCHTQIDTLYIYTVLQVIVTAREEPIRRADGNRTTDRSLSL